MGLGRLVFLKILGGIAIMMMLSLGTAVLWIQNTPTENSFSDREPASVGDDRVFSDQGEIPASEVFAKTAVSDAIRARKVAFNSIELGRVLESGKTLNLDLFPDKNVRIQLQNASNYRVNDHLLVGQIAGDSQSQVRLQVASDLMDGQIQGSREQYRIVPMGSGVLWIIQIKTKNSN